MAQRLIDESHRTDIEIKFTGLRSGEKLDEVLFSALESGQPSAHPLISKVAVPAIDPWQLRVIDLRDQEGISSAMADQLQPVAITAQSAAAEVVRHRVANRG